MKKEKYVSLFVIPHGSGRQRTLSFSRKTVKTLVVMIPLVMLVLTLFLVDYFHMWKLRGEYKDLQLRYEGQEQQLDQYKASIRELEGSIARFDEYRQKLNVMAGLKSEEVLDEDPGIGGPDSGQELSPPSSGDGGLTSLQEMERQAEGIQDNLATLSHFFTEQAVVLAQTPSIAPTQGYMVSGFKYRDDPFTGKRTFHPGLDISTQKGNPVVATADGIVLQTAVDRSGGNTIKLSHPQTGYVTVYCHLSKFLVKPGQRVERGETIGLVGRTGRARGPHVHYEVRLNGKRLNPYHFILDD
jgi:murein DD-endopeptidase MepM/ murein hydrolase activator NlpD